jgi:spermidine synthase
MTATSGGDADDAHGGPAVASPGRPVALPDWLAVSLVVGTSASVLVLEILAGRLLAPYVGVSLETYTGIIGTVLTGIAVGAWAGGTLADRIDPRRLIPVLLVLGGALAIATIPTVRAVGDLGGTGRGARILVLSAVGFLPSATVLSAVPPAVVKLQLRDLSTTGTTVGRLSAYGTAGAIAGTFLTGFVLVTWAAVTTLIVVVGVLLAVAGVALWFAVSRREGAEIVAAGAVAALALGGVAAIDGPCDVRTAYYCVSIREDPFDAGGRVLVLDDLRHSYVDLDDPTDLGFWYVRRLVDAIEVHAPDGPIDAVHLGGGGFTIPRYVRATRPGSEQTVMEIDGDLVDLARSELALAPGDDLEVRVVDARLGLAEHPSDSADVVIGDSFGGRAVPWHLATEEFITEIDRVLRPGGIYAANIIDGSRQRFLRAEAATIARVLPHVAVILGPGVADGGRGNSVIVASDEPLHEAALIAAAGDGDDVGTLVADLDDYLDGARILTDDHAPVDQLLAGGV